MTTAYTSLLGLALPVTGELSGTWGDTVNNSITSLLDTSVAGTTNVSTDTDVTLTTTTGAANTARQAILLFSGARTALRTVTAPAQSKIYTVINATTGGFAVKLVGSGPTTGLTIPNGASATVAWNGSDFIEVGAGSIGNLVVNGTLTVTGATTLQSTLAVTGNITNTAGTANGVAYLNGSKVVTSGSALTFDGTNLGVGTTSPAAKLGVAGNIFISGASSYIAFDATQSGSTPAFIQYASNSLVFGAGSSEQMRLTSTGLGIGTSSPSQKLEVAGNAKLTGTNLSIVPSTATSAAYTLNTNTGGNFFLGIDSSTGASFTGTAYGRFLYSGGAYPIVFLTNDTERMRLDSSGNLGIGTSSPVSKIDARAASATMGNYQTIQAFSTDATAINLGGGISLGGNYSGSSTFAQFASIAGRKENATDGNYAGYLQFGTNSQATGVREVMRLDSSGNLGLGVTPSAGGANANYRLFEIGLGGGGSLYSGGGQTLFCTNVAWSGGTANYKASSIAPLMYSQESGTHIWKIAPSGTAGNAITFTQAMTLDASGNVQIGTTTSSGRLHLASSGSTAQTITSVGTNVYSSVSFVNTTTGYGYDIGFGGSASVAPNSFYVYGGSSASVKMMIDSSGNLGLGVTPSAWWSSAKALQIAGSTGFLGFSGVNGNIVTNTYYDGSNYRYLATAAAFLYEQSGGHKWSIAPSGTAGNAITFTQAMTLDASGRLGIGTTSPQEKLQLEGSGSQYMRVKTTTTNADIYFGITSSSVGYVGTGGSDPLAFYTGGTERARIDSSGNLLVGTTSVLGSARATFKAGSTLPGISIGMANSSGTYAAQIFFDGDNTDSGSIDVNNDANTTAYTTSSDYRLKLNVQPIANALTKVGQLNPVTWNWKKNPSLNSSGFIAHELQAVCPDAVTGYKDEVDAEGNPKYQGIDTSFLVATLTAALQELNAKFDAYVASHP